MPMRGSRAAAACSASSDQVDAGGDGATQIRAVAVHHVERGRGAEIDHDQRAAVTLVPGEGVEQPVGADFGRVVDLDLEAPIEVGPGDQRLDVEPVAAEAAEMVQGGGDDGADDGTADLGRLHVRVLQEGQQPDGVFVRGALGVRADAPNAPPSGAIVYGEDDVGVAGVDDEQHVREGQGAALDPPKTGGPWNLSSEQDGGGSLRGAGDGTGDQGEEDRSERADAGHQR